MSKTASIYRIMISGFLQRVRTYQYLIVLLLIIILGYVAIPAVDAGYTTLVLDDHRGFYNSAWFGVIGGVWLNTFLSLFGFFVIKNAIQMDFTSQTTDILAATQMTNAEYAIGKMLSNFLILLSMVLVFDLSLIVMFFIRAETSVFNLWLLINPSILISVPMLALVAAMGVVFEIVPFLRKGFGNLIYIILWFIILFQSVLSVSEVDPIAINTVMNAIFDQAQLQYPNINRDSFVIGGDAISDATQTILFNGINWTWKLVGYRLLWIGVAIGIVFLCSLFFNRFNPEKYATLLAKGTRKRKEKIITLIPSDNNPEPIPETSNIVLEPSPMIITTSFTAITTSFQPQFLSIIKQELKLYLKLIPRWWMIGLLILIIVGLSVPFEVLQTIVFPITWLWPVLIWSKLGVLESNSGTDSIINSTPYPLKRQFSSIWVVGLILTLGTGISWGIRQLITLNGIGFFAWIIGGYFITAFAITSGSIFKSSKLFEFLYVLLWYLGPMNRVPWLDFIGVVNESLQRGIWIVYFGIAIFLTICAFYAKKRAIKNS